jgi:hypothetical protein
LRTRRAISPSFVNLQAFGFLGLTVLLPLLARADEVIE